MDKNPSPSSEVLGVDVGEARVGVARASLVAKIAEPLKMIGAQEAVSELKHLVEDCNATAVVVGLPRGLDGQETSQTQAVRQWVAAAKPQISAQFYWQDEALTSVEAEKQSTSDTDAAAAAIILQDFLDTPEAQRVGC